MAGLIAWLGRMFTGSLIALLGSWRTWVGGVLFKVVLVMVLYNVMSMFLGEILEWVAGQLGAVTGPTGVVSSFDLAGITQVGAWLVNKMRIPECFAYMMSCILLKFALRKIPFVRW
jgi:hypothetical protein